MHSIRRLRRFRRESQKDFWFKAYQIETREPLGVRPLMFMFSFASAIGPGAERNSQTLNGANALHS
jgi:hypothetical protein